MLIVDAPGGGGGGIYYGGLELWILMPVAPLLFVPFLSIGTLPLSSTLILFLSFGFGVFLERALRGWGTGCIVKSSRYIGCRLKVFVRIGDSLLTGRKP